jgi:DNA-binding HxlR family transcriptional regulator
MAGVEQERSDSPLADAVARVGDRWSLLIVQELLAGPRRFNDLEESIGGLAPNILSQRLKHLEREGVLLARPYSDRPVRFEYDLTAAGRELAGALRLLAQWGGRSGDDEGAPRHVVCGTPLETRWYCPTCGLTVDDPEDEELHRV